VTLTLDSSDGESRTVTLSTRSCLDLDRWKVMPSLSGFKSLQRVDLYKSRYIESVDDESLLGLIDLRQLYMTRCSRLHSIPVNIGRLTALLEVRKCSFSFIIPSMSNPL
jgi:hypothetical protein